MALRFVIGGAALAAVGLCTAARGEDREPSLPIIDVDAHCTKRASLTRDPAQARIAINECVVQEQAYYDTLKYVWPTAPAEVRSECLRLMYDGRNIAERSYSPLSSCLDTRMAIWAQRNEPLRRFQP